jgi:hypothetical protein
MGEMGHAIPSVPFFFAEVGFNAADYPKHSADDCRQFLLPERLK